METNWKAILFYDKITDKLLHRHITQITTLSEINNIINDPILTLVNYVTQNNVDNIGYIVVDDDNKGSKSYNYCIVNGKPEKQYHLLLSCDAVDNDGDGLPDIDGDGISTTQFILKVVKHDNHSQIADWSGQAEVCTTRGKLLNTTSGLFNIVNGVGYFVLRSVPETVSKLSLNARLVYGLNNECQRAQHSNMVEMNFR